MTFRGFVRSLKRPKPVGCAIHRESSCVYALGPRNGGVCGPPLAQRALSMTSLPGSSSPPDYLTRTNTSCLFSKRSRVMYRSHVPTSPTQKGAVAVTSALSAFFNPKKADMVAALGEVTGHHALTVLHRRMSSHEVGRRILMEKPRVKVEEIDFARLKALPEDTFGRHYATFMDHHGFSPDERDEVRFVDDVELAYVLQRFRECHDFWHVLCGLPPTVEGEIALKWLEMIQTELPVCSLSALVGPLRLSSVEMKRLATVYIPWAARTGREASLLLNVYYEKHFEEPISELRKKLNITAAPPMPE